MKYEINTYINSVFKKLDIFEVPKTILDFFRHFYT